MYVTLMKFYLYWLPYDRWGTLRNSAAAFEGSQRKELVLEGSPLCFSVLREAPPAFASIDLARETNNGMEIPLNTPPQTSPSPQSTCRTQQQCKCGRIICKQWDLNYCLFILEVANCDRKNIMYLIILFMD